MATLFFCELTLSFGSSLSFSSSCSFSSACWQKRTKTPILCSESPKTRVPDPKSAQKPRFCARNARKQGFQTPKAHKNPDFVLGKGGRRAWEQQQANAKSIGKRGSSSRPTQRSIEKKKECCGPPKRSIGKKKESCEPPKLSIGKSKCAQICLFLKLVR